MKWPIFNRKYWIQEVEHGWWREITYRGIWWFERVRVKHQLHKAQIQEIYEQHVEDLVKMIEESELMLDCWLHMSNEMRVALVFSWYMREVRGEDKISNVHMLDNWLMDDYFADVYAHLAELVRWKNILRWRTWMKAKMRLGGKHEKGLRFGNIHLVLDHVKGEPVLGVHWDSHPPQRSVIGTLKHLLLDDMTS